MNTLLNGLGGTLIFLGLIAMAGSANDCDGACVENANTIAEMLIVIAGGLVAMALGAGMMMKAYNNG